MFEITDTMRTDLQKDGAIKIEGLLDEARLAECRRCFDYSIANPSPTALDIFAGTKDAHYNDLGSGKTLKVYQPMLEKLGFADLMADLWGSERIWYFGEEIFIKDGGKVGRSPWHQDTSYVPAYGAHFANIWISFEPLPARNALEVIKGSHLGPQYDGTAYSDPDDPTKPVWGTADFPQLPDIEAERAADAQAWDTLSWDLQPGDAIVLNSGALHGGAPVDAACPTRHTLVLRFFGDKMHYRPFPDAKPDYFMDVRAFDDGALSPGDLYRSDHFLQLR
jgi:hypothetical protein